MLQAKSELMEWIDDYIKEKIILAGQAISKCVLDEKKIIDGDVIVTFGWWVSYHFLALAYCKQQNICPTLISPSCEELLFRSVLNSAGYNIEHTVFTRIFICPCFEFGHGQLGKMGEIKTRVNKTCSSLLPRGQGFQ